MGNFLVVHRVTRTQATNGCMTKPSDGQCPFMAGHVHDRRDTWLWVTRNGVWQSDCAIVQKRSRVPSDGSTDTDKGMQQTNYSVSEAARIVNRGRATITRHMDAGDLSFDINDQGNRTVDASELLRVYRDRCDFDRASGNKKTNTNRSVAVKTTADPDFSALREQYEARIADLKDALSESKETIAEERDTRKLLEDKTKEQTGWKDALSEMEAKIASKVQQEIAAMKKQSEREISELKERHRTKIGEVNNLKTELSKERNKSLWQKLVG